MKIKFDKDYWVTVGHKIVETIISVKVWVIFSIIVISTILLVKSFIDGTVWGTVNTAVISTVIAVREGFKITRTRQQKEKYIIEECEDSDDSGYHRDSTRFPSKPRNVDGIPPKKNMTKKSMIFD
jgi:hypothetical protein